MVPYLKCIGHMPVEKDGLYCDGLVAQNSHPVCREGIPIRWVLGREGGHLVRLRVQLLLEEYGQVTFCHVPYELFVAIDHL